MDNDRYQKSQFTQTTKTGILNPSEENQNVGNFFKTSKEPMAVCQKHNNRRKFFIINSESPLTQRLFCSYCLPSLLKNKSFEYTNYINTLKSFSEVSYHFNDFVNILRYHGVMYKNQSDLERFLNSRLNTLQQVTHHDIRRNNQTYKIMKYKTISVVFDKDLEKLSIIFKKIFKSKTLSIIQYFLSSITNMLLDFQIIGRTFAESEFIKINKQKEIHDLRSSNDEKRPNYLPITNKDTFFKTEETSKDYLKHKLEKSKEKHLNFLFIKFGKQRQNTRNLINKSQILKSRHSNALSCTLPQNCVFKSLNKTNYQELEFNNSKGFNEKRPSLIIMMTHFDTEDYRPNLCKDSVIKTNDSDCLYFLYSKYNPNNVTFSKNFVICETFNPKFANDLSFGHFKQFDKSRGPSEHEYKFNYLIEPVFPSSELEFNLDGQNQSRWEIVNLE